MYCACGANADYVVDVVQCEKLMRVYAYRGHTHTASHDGNLLALVKARVALYAAHVVYKPCTVEIRFGDKLCAQRIAGHEHRLCEIALDGRVMRCRNVYHFDSPFLVFTIIIPC